MASGNFLGNSPVSTNLYVTWSSTPNTATNTSSVTVNLYMRHYKLYASALSGSYLSVGGNSSNYSKSISYSGSSQIDTLLATKTVTVTHNADGSGTCNITGTFVLNGTLSGTYVGTITASRTVTLDKIARSSSIDKITNASGTTISSIDSGSGIRVYWTPAAASYKYRIQCVVSGSTYTFPSASTFYTPNSTSSYYASITTAHSWVPSKPSDNVSVKLYTYDSGGTQIGDVKNGSFALNVPTSIKPSISSFTATVVDGKGGNYVLGRSKVKLTVNATKGNGAANISYYTFNGPYIDGQNSSVVKTSTATSYNITSGLLNYPDTLSYSVTVTDTRDRSIVSPTVSITVYPYSSPAISSITVQRCTSSGVIDPSGTYAYVTVKSTYSSINGANTRTVVLSNSSDNYTAKTTIQATSDTSDTYSGIYGGSFAIGSSYTIRATITDTAYSSTDTKNAILKTAERPLNILSNGKGVAIGKMAEANNLFDVGWNSKFRNDVTIDGLLKNNSVYALKGREVIPDNSNFNNYKNIGCYIVTGNVAAATMTNIPVATAGILNVMHVAGNNYDGAPWSSLLQDYTTLTGYKYARYIYTDGTANNWGYDSWKLVGGPMESTLNTNGYQKLPSGFIIQWGSATIPASTSELSVTFPITFPNAARSVVCQNGWSNSRNIVHTVSGLSTTKFKAHPYVPGTNAVPTVSSVFYWIAIGY